MKHTYTSPLQTLPVQPLTFFDVSPLTARLHMMVALTLTLMDIEWMDKRGVIKNKRLQRRCMKRVSAITSRVRRVAAAILKVKTHNALLEKKLEMLGNSAWRGRVLKDLGGMARLKLWDAAWLLHLACLAGDAPETPVKPVKPVKPEPIWWRSPERIAESERLKARFRLCDKACVNQRTLKDPFKVDFEGEFRLAPIPRGQYAKGKPRIYSKVDICEYGYDAMPIWKDFGIGLATVYPVEFYAAMVLDNEDASHDVIPDLVQFAEQDALRCETQQQELEFEDMREDNIEIIDIAANDNRALMEFIGRKNYNYIFYDPG